MATLPHPVLPKLPVWRCMAGGLRLFFSRFFKDFAVAWPVLLAYVVLRHTSLEADAAYGPFAFQLEFQAGLALLGSLLFAAVAQYRAHATPDTEQPAGGLWVYVLQRVGIAALGALFAVSFVLLLQMSSSLMAVDTDFIWIARAMVFFLWIFFAVLGVQASAWALMLWPALSDSIRPFHPLDLWDRIQGRCLRILLCHTLPAIAGFVVAFLFMVAGFMALFGIAVAFFEVSDIHTWSQMLGTLQTESLLATTEQAAITVPDWYMGLMRFYDGIWLPLSACCVVLGLSHASEVVYKHIP